MFKALFILWLVVPLLAIVIQPNEEEQQTMRRLSNVFCVENPDPIKMNGAVDCSTKLSPEPVRQMYRDCIRQVYNVEQGNKPSFCFFLLPNADNLQTCLRDAEPTLAQHGIIYTEQARDEFKTNYRACLVKVAGQQ